MKEKATNLIRLCIFDNVILDLKTPKDVCDKWENQYMFKTLINKLSANQHLYSLKMRERGNLQAHVNIFNNILAYFKLLDVNVDGEDKSITLLCSLPSCYDHMVTTLTYGKETFTLDFIYFTLL